MPCKTGCQISNPVLGKNNKLDVTSIGLAIKKLGEQWKLELLKGLSKQFLRQILKTFKRTHAVKVFTRGTILRCIHKISLSYLAKSVIVSLRWSSISGEINLSSFSKVPIGGELVISKPMLKRSVKQKETNNTIIKFKVTR